MMRKREAGQALILALILLAIGALLTVPALRLTSTALKSSQIANRHVKALYAADAAQEYVLWKLLHDGFGSEFTYDGQEITFPFDVCGVPVDVTVIMRAVPGAGGVNLVTDDVIKPTKTVEPNAHEHGFQTYTYTINLEQVSSNTSRGLDAIYDVVPKYFDDDSYVEGSSYLRVGSGPWEPISDPSSTFQSGRLTLRWPAEGDFGSPIRDFEVRQVKELKFQLDGLLDDNDVHCNWVVLKPWNTINYGAPIIVGDPSKLTCKNMLMEIYKTSDPEVIPVGVETEVKYAIVFNNVTPADYELQGITDYLPPEFYYFGPGAGGYPPSGITTEDPDEMVLENIDGVDRWRLHWTLGDYKIPHGDTDNLTFWAHTTWPGATWPSSSSRTWASSRKQEHATGAWPWRRLPTACSRNSRG